MKPQRPEGQTLVEFSLIFVIFVVMLMGIFDLGRAVFAYTSITNGAREGARLGIVNQSTTAIRQKANNSAAMADKAPAAVTVRFAKPTSATTANDCAPIAVGCNVVVEYKTTFTPATPFISALTGNITVTASSVEPIEYVCGVTGALVTDPAQCPRQP